MHLEAKILKDGIGLGAFVLISFLVTLSTAAPSDNKQQMTVNYIEENEVFKSLIGDSWTPAGQLIAELIERISADNIKESLKFQELSEYKRKNEIQLISDIITKVTSNEIRDKESSRIQTMPDGNWEKEVFLSKIIGRTSADRMRESLKYFSAKPHIAASPRDEELANHIRDKFDEAGFDSSKLVPYNLYLSKPDINNPNKITLTKNGEKIFETQHKETPIHARDEDPDFVHAFNAYSPAATVSTEPGVGAVYVNYGRVEDFEKLEELGVNVSGHIAIVRYGEIYRGNKVQLAEKFGAKGVIIFSDPEEVAPEGISPEEVYDHTWWLPGTGMQRGSVFVGDGDPLTPEWPSTEHAYRIEEDEANLRKIPSQPIGYSDAKEILRRLGGNNAPRDWQGGIPGLTYKLGPFFNKENYDVSLTLSTHNSGKIEKNYNVIGIIKGSIEPDRYVLFGNHRDAWGYGSVDPSSGTVQLLETARVFGTLMKDGWRPRRTLIFCSWGAEEYALLGSQEWVEENIDKLQSRAVAYINTDMCAQGPKLEVASSPLLYDVFLDVTKLIPGVENASKTMFEEWKEYSMRYDPDAPQHPVIENLGSSSDFGPFAIYGGIPAADITFSPDRVKYDISSYPFYHTGYETFYMMSAFVDPEFKIHQGCGRLSSLVIKYLADSSIIPYSLSRLPVFMLKTLRESKYRNKLMEIYDKYEQLEYSVIRFEKSTRQFESKIKTFSLEALNPLELRAINDQMMKLQQIFIIPGGLPGRPIVRNAVTSPSQFDDYASDGFPGISDLLYGYDDLSQDEKVTRNKLIKRHISDLTIMTDRATAFLQDVYYI